MFDIGWSELLVVGLLALLVVGPKELPGLLRTVGQYVGKARSMAREFQRSMEDAAREADITALKDLKDAKRDLDKMARIDFPEQAKRSSANISSGGKPPAASGSATTASTTSAAEKIPTPAPADRAETKTVSAEPGPAPAATGTDKA